MKKLCFLVVLLIVGTASAQAPTHHLSLDQYLEQVKTQSPEGRQLTENITAAEMRLEEAEMMLSPEGYLDYKYGDNRMQPPIPFQARRTQGYQFRAGARKQTTFGLTADVFISDQHTILSGINTQFFPNPMYHQPVAGIELKQSLWKNGFGDATRAELRSREATSRTNLMNSQFAMKNLMVKAKNTYWSLVSYNQIVRLQEQNVERAKKLTSWMNNRANLRLMDDVDAMQAQASLETRELELQKSLDDRAILLREFNMLRAAAVEQPVALMDLPSQEMLLKKAEFKKMSREDFRMAYEQADIIKYQSIAAKSNIMPTLDLKGRITTSGMDRHGKAAYDEMWTGAYPAWEVGVSLAFPLDFSLFGKMKKALDAQNRATNDVKQQAMLNEERAWIDLNKQQTEAQGRFQRSLKLENLQTQLVKKEQQRLRNGRTTTFQAISMEQNLALSQIQRIQTQLALVQLRNIIQSFDDKTVGDQQ